MIRAAVFLCVTLPVCAYAQDPSRQEFSFLSSFLQMLAALAIVIGLILVTRHYSGKLFKGFIPGQTPSKHIRFVETRFIGPKKSLMLVEVGGEYLLLGSTDTHITLIKDVSVLEEIEIIEEPITLREGISTLLRSNVSRNKAQHE